MNKIYKKPNTIEKYMFFYIYENGSKCSIDLPAKNPNLYRISIPDDFPDLCCKKYLGRHNSSYYINDREIESKLTKLRRIFVGNNEEINFDFIFVTKKDDVSISGIFSFSSAIRILTKFDISVNLSNKNLYELYKNSINFTTKIIW